MPEPIGGVQPFAELARNGPTVVYKGYQRAHDRFVLLKAVRADLGDEKRLGEHLAAEARLAAQIRHPNVVAVLETGHDGAVAYLITEFVEGLDLRDLLARGPLPVPLAVYVVREAAEGLRAVHASGILHRDLKPANVLVSESGEVKVADFGLASLAPEGGVEMRGTLAYLAPEVVRGEPPTPASDLFALGVVLAEALAGRAVFARDDPGATLDAVVNHDPIPALAADPRVPPALVVLVAKLLAKDPAQRLASAMLLVSKLEAAEDLHGRAGAEDLAAFVRDPESYKPPAPTSATLGTEAATKTAGAARDPAARDPAARDPAAHSVAKRRWMPWFGAAAALLLALLVGYGLLRPSPPTSQEDQLGDTAALQQARPRLAQPADSTRDASPEAGTAAVPPLEDGPAEPTLLADAGADGTRLEPSAVADDVADGVPDQDPAARDPEPRNAPEAAASEQPEAQVGTLDIVAEPWAEVRIDGEAVGTTPLATLTVAAGPHTVTFENPDFPSHAVPVVVAGGEGARVAVSLWDLVGRITLVVSPWARVSVNGAYWDTVPPQERPLILRPGTHRLVLEHPALGTREATLAVAAGEERTLRINFAEPLP